MDADRLNDLERLAALRDSGALTEDEFVAQKQSLLAQEPAAASPSVQRGWLARRWKPLVAIAAVAVAVAVIVVALLASGSSKMTVEEYEAATAAAHADAVQSMIDDGFSDASVEDAFANLIDGLEAMNPPSDAEAAHEQLIAEYREDEDLIPALGAFLQSAIDAGMTGEPDPLDILGAVIGGASSVKSAATAVDDLNQIEDEFAAEGVTVVTFASPLELYRALDDAPPTIDE